MLPTEAAKVHAALVATYPAEAQVQIHKITVNFCT